MNESELEDCFRAIFFLFVIFTKIGGNTKMNIKTLNGADTKTLNDKITNGKITNGEKSEGYKQTLCKTDVAATLQDSCAFVDFFQGASLTRNSDSLVTLMMVLEIEPQPAENTPFLAKIQIQGSVQRFQDKQQSDEIFKFISHDILTSAELKFRFLPQQRTIENPGWLNAEVKTATWRSYVSKIQTTIPQILNCWSKKDWKDLLQKKRTWIDEEDQHNGQYF